MTAVRVPGRARRHSRWTGGGYRPGPPGGATHAPGGAPRTTCPQAGRRAAVAVLPFLVLAAGVAGADLRTAVTLEARLTGLSNPGDEPLLGGGSSAKLDLVATGNRDVRGQLTLVANLSAAGADQGTGAHVHPSPPPTGATSTLTRGQATTDATGIPIRWRTTG